MTSGALVVVLAVAAGISLLRGLVPGLPLPGPLLELLCGIVLGPTVLNVVKVDPLLSAGRLAAPCRGAGRLRADSHLGGSGGPAA